MDLAGDQAERDVVERLDLAEALEHIAHLQDGRSVRGRRGHHRRNRCGRIRIGPGRGSLHIVVRLRRGLLWLRGHSTRIRMQYSHRGGPPSPKAGTNGPQPSLMGTPRRQTSRSSLTASRPDRVSRQARDRKDVSDELLRACQASHAPRRPARPGSTRVRPLPAPAGGLQREAGHAHRLATPLLRRPQVPHLGQRSAGGHGQRLRAGRRRYPGRLGGRRGRGRLHRQRVRHADEDGHRLVRRHQGPARGLHHGAAGHGPALP